MPPLAIPALLTHHVSSSDNSRITVSVNIDHAFESVDKLLYHDNLLGNNTKSNNAKEGAYALTCAPRKTSYTRQATIVIPSYEAHDYLKICIDSVMKYSSNIEIVIIDNGSGSRVKNYLRKLEWGGLIKLTLNQSNYGFSHAVNQGIKAAKPENDIVLLNNDAMVTTNWLDALREVIENVCDAGLVVPRQVLLPGERTIEVHLPKVNPDREADVNLSKHHDNIINPVFDQVHGYVELNFAPFFCVYVKRETINEAGLLDEISGPHYRSDRIYCDIVRNMYGKRIIYTPYSKVYHFHQRATKELKSKSPDMYKAMFEMNKWEQIRKVIEKES